MRQHSPPTRIGHPLWGNWLQYRQNPLQFMVDTFQTCGDVVRLRFATIPLYAINHPDIIHEVMVGQAAKFHKNRVMKALLRRFIGDGLLTSEGVSWERQRQLVQPAFHTKRLNAYVQEMVEQISQAMNDWQDGTTCDIHHEMLKMTMTVVAKVLFGADAAAAYALASPEMYAALARYIEKTVSQQIVPVPVPSWIPTPSNRAFQRLIETTNRIVLGVIQERRVATKDDDLISALLLAHNEDGSQMTDIQIHDEVMTLLTAGHDTTANSLAWTWYLLSQHRECEARLFEEVDRVLGERLPTTGDLPHLRYTNMILKEALRLYPPAWLLGRQAVREVTVGGYQLAKGSMVLISPYTLHRDTRWFEQPEDFLPERFSEENEKLIHQHAYIPFGDGPRVCIGNRFALMEMTLILAMVAQRYELSLVSNQKVEVEPRIELHPKYGIQMQLRQRERRKESLS